MIAPGAAVYATGTASGDAQGAAQDHAQGPAQVDVIDRWAALYQRARLWKRRTRRAVSAALRLGDTAAVQEARARHRRARHWESLTRARYLEAVFAAYA